MTAKYTTLAAKGDTDAMLAMVYCHRFGCGVSYDPEASRQWALRAWKGGDAMAGFLAMRMIPPEGGEVFRRPAEARQ